MNLVSGTSEVNLNESDETSNTTKKQQLMNSIRSCLNAMKTKQEAFNNFLELYSKH